MALPILYICSTLDEKHYYQHIIILFLIIYRFLDSLILNILSANSLYIIYPNLILNHKRCIPNLEKRHQQWKKCIDKYKNCGFFIKVYNKNRAIYGPCRNLPSWYCSYLRQMFGNKEYLVVKFAIKEKINPNKISGVHSLIALQTRLEGAVENATCSSYAKFNYTFNLLFYKIVIVYYPVLILI